MKLEAVSHPDARGRENATAASHASGEASDHIYSGNQQYAGVETIGGSRSRTKAGGPQTCPNEYRRGRRSKRTVERVRKAVGRAYRRWATVVVIGVRDGKGVVRRRGQLRM